MRRLALPFALLALPLLAACQAPSQQPAPQPSTGPERQVLTDVTWASGSVGGGVLTMLVQATAATPGWEDLTLEPVVYVQAPPDGIYDATLYGTPPEGMVAQVLTPVEVPWSRPVDALPKALRIHAQQSCLVVLLTMPEPAPDVRGCRVVRIQGLPTAP